MIESESEGASQTPAIAESTPDRCKRFRGKARIGVQEEQYVAARCGGTGIHLVRSASLRSDHTGAPRSDPARSIYRTAVDDHDLERLLLAFDRFDRGLYERCLVERRDDD